MRRVGCDRRQATTRWGLYLERERVNIFVLSFFSQVASSSSPTPRRINTVYSPSFPPTSSKLEEVPGRVRLCVERVVVERYFMIRRLQQVEVFEGLGGEETFHSILRLAVHVAYVGVVTETVRRLTPALDR